LAPAATILAESEIVSDADASDAGRELWLVGDTLHGLVARTAAKPGDAGRPHNWRRHPYSWLGWTPALRATADTLAPASSVAATSCSFSAELQRRRRCTDLITSTRAFAMGLFL